MDGGRANQAYSGLGNVAKEGTQIQMTGNEKRLANDGPILRIIAVVACGDGKSVVDIVETIPHFAYGFVRRFMRDPDVIEIVVADKNAPMNAGRSIVCGDF